LFDKTKNHAKRVSRYYVTREKSNRLFISHEPLGVYNQDKGSFLRDRANAYALIASSIPSHIDTICSESVWLDYGKEGWLIEYKKNTPVKRLISVYFFWLNLINWRKDPGKSWYSIGSSTYQLASMPKSDFLLRFGQ
jgi:hypothetical protein